MSRHIPSRENEAVVSRLSFPNNSEQFSHIHCDVGGGTGKLLMEILGKNQNVKGINLDFLKAIKSSNELNSSLFGNRYDGEVGDFFENVPIAHSYSLKHIIHDWPDEKCVIILKNCKEACLKFLMRDKEKSSEAAGARGCEWAEQGLIYVIDRVIGRKGDPNYIAHELDMLMLAILGARERSLDEFIMLGNRAGLRFLEERNISWLEQSVLVFNAN